MELQVPVLRRVLETMLVFDHAFEPTAVTAALQSLPTAVRTQSWAGLIIRTKVDMGDSEDAYVFTQASPPDPAALSQLRFMYEAKCHIIQADS